MNEIHIISASAGSGKTYRLAQLLEQAVTAGQVRPEAVLATTFTNKAAAELQERVRIKLLGAGQTADAQRLTAARIGTVNAICGRLVGDFAFDLGLSPQLHVLDEEQATVALHRSLSMVMTDEEQTELHGLVERMVQFDWQDVVKDIVDKARANGMAPQQVRDCAQQSKTGFLELLGKVEGDAQALDDALAKAIKGFMAAVTKGNDTTATTAKALELTDHALRRLQAGRALPWKDWVALAKLSVAKASNPAAEPVRIAAAAQDRHPRLHSDVSRAIELVFELAARALEAYQEHKREMGALDFVDQENLALGLLDNPEVKQQLGEQLDLVLVDEFQDTSPIQLAIFLKLAEIARRNIWVGDQKQAIYGFRGSDPALMDAAIVTILGKTKPETLPKSYRSRPELVKLTSDLFAPAFELKGIPPERVRLEPADPKEPAGLGVILEYFNLAAKNQNQDAAALAAGVQDLLGDDVMVRDVATKQPRTVRPGDVAILCRSNDTCAKLARELAALGIRAVLPRIGLMATLEARVVLAGLRLWVDQRDTLAAAELGRLITYAGQEEQWFAAVMQKPGSEAFGDTAAVKAIGTAREQEPKLGALAVYDAVVELVEARELCLQWGDAATRLANLEALRGHTVAYAQACAAQGAGCTPAGLVATLMQLELDEADSQGVSVDEQAVVISTWHSAKGLEWPITVLFELGLRDSQTAALGVQMVNERQQVQLDDPLGGRWIRYWPSPYDARNNKTPFHDRLSDHPATQAAREQAERESLRLLYVGWTRARDRVVLAARGGKLCDGAMGLLAGPNGPLLTEPSGDQVTWAGRKVAIKCREVSPAEPVAIELKPGIGYAAAGPKDHPPAFIQPSAVAQSGQIPSQYEQVHPRIAISGKPDWSSMGSAVHAFLCADRPGLAPQERLDLADEILRRWNVRSALTPGDLAGAGEGLRIWVDKRWPGATWHREWPLRQKMADGSIIRGSSDLVLETAGGMVLVDHKSYPGTIAEALKKAAEFQGQMRTYGQVITAATAKPLLGSFIHLPVLGIVVSLAFSPS